MIHIFKVAKDGVYKTAGDIPYSVKAIEPTAQAEHLKKGWRLSLDEAVKAAKKAAAKKKASVEAPVE